MHVVAYAGCCCCHCNNSADFVSRFFAPAVAINEDPVTGSAHCALTPYWAAKLGKTEMEAWQVCAAAAFQRRTHLFTSEATQRLHTAHTALVAAD